MSEPVAPQTPGVRAFPKPEGQDIPDRIYAEDQVITGEAVALKIQPASPIQLLAAGAIDLFIAFALVLASMVFLSLVGTLSPEAGATYVILAIVFAVIVIPAIVETATGGKSVGKWALGVQIVRDDGGAIRFRHAITRALVGLFEIFMTLGSIALIATVASARHKRLGDLLAGTYPISLNTGATLPPPLIIPPELIPWAQQVDVTRLPGTLAWRARQFLNTTNQLDPARRHPIAAALAQEVQPFVSMPPPPNTHPERFLAAVLVIRRDTEFRNAQRVHQTLTKRTDYAVPYDLPG